MWRTAWIGTTILALALIAAAAPAPVLQDLGEVQPTPGPTPEPFQKKRLITAVTIQNSADGETIVTFEATDVGQNNEGDFKTLAQEQYSFTHESERFVEIKEKILADLRVLERSMLEYVQAAGPPRERERMMPHPPPR